LQLPAEIEYPYEAFGSEKTIRPLFALQPTAVTAVMTMRVSQPHDPFLHKVAKMGLVASLVIAAAFILSLRWTFGVGTPFTIFGFVGMMVNDGNAMLVIAAPLDRWQWVWEAATSMSSWWRTSQVVEGSVGAVCLPLWMPFGLVTGPSAFLWWRSRPLRL